MIHPPGNLGSKQIYFRMISRNQAWIRILSASHIILHLLTVEPKS